MAIDPSDPDAASGPRSGGIAGSPLRKRRLHRCSLSLEGSRRSPFGKLRRALHSGYRPHHPSSALAKASSWKEADRTSSFEEISLFFEIPTPHTGIQKVVVRSNSSSTRGFA